jgi:hypothetical protein
VPTGAAAAPAGQLTCAVHILLAPTFFDPAETPGVSAADVKFSFERYKGGGASSLKARVELVLEANEGALPEKPGRC